MFPPKDNKPLSNKYLRKIFDFNKHYSTAKVFMIIPNLGKGVHGHFHRNLNMYTHSRGPCDNE